MVGGRDSLRCVSSICAMGLRAVADLEDYTIAELVELIDKASTVLRQKVAELSFSC